MIKKMLSLLGLFVLFMGLQQSFAQDLDCDFVGEIADAVELVEQAADDANMRVPFGLTFQVDKLEAICDGTALFPCPPEVILERMITLVTAIDDGTFVCPCWPDDLPEDFTSAISDLLALLTGGV
ncbi:hypothetical protein [uncultured Draconibacterium sp.]|uniref:hypothetical protein n=1 Tax=uncultured Draconibacterium sp. TaxID=1573823 RepID=UPI003216D5D2